MQMHPLKSTILHTFPSSSSYTPLQSASLFLSMFSGTQFTTHSIYHQYQSKHMMSQWHIPLPTFSMLVLSNCSLRSAMTALWDWRVWSDTIILLSRSRLTSSRDITSFSSRHTSSSRCCCCDCHCKQTSNLQFVSWEKKEFSMCWVNHWMILFCLLFLQKYTILSVVCLYYVNLFLKFLITVNSNVLSQALPEDQTPPYLFFLLCQLGLEAVSVGHSPLQTHVLVRDDGLQLVLLFCLLLDAVLQHLHLLHQLLQLPHLGLQLPLSRLLTEGQSSAKCIAKMTEHLGIWCSGFNFFVKFLSSSNVLQFSCPQIPLAFTDCYCQTQLSMPDCSVCQHAPIYLLRSINLQSLFSPHP